FPAIPARQTNRREYRGEAVGLSLAGELSEAGDPALVPFGFANDPGLLREVAAIAGEALAIELSDDQRLRETLRFLRFSDREVARAREGYGPSQQGRGIAWRVAVALFPPSSERILARKEEFARGEGDALARRVAGSGGIGWLSTKGDYPIDRVRAGRAFQRIALAAALHSLAIQPLTSALADFPGAGGLRARLEDLLGLPPTHTLQMLFRCGYAKPVPPSPRRDVSDLLSA
ncbi:MAG: hypothetical protein QXL43_04065, partial [Methanolinea sp.]